MVDFETKAAAFKRLGIKIVAGSVDTGDHARDLASGLRLGFVKLVHSLDSELVSAATGVITGLREDRPIMNAAGFLLDPDGKVVSSVISSGPIGRFVPADVMAKVAFDQASRG